MSDVFVSYKAEDRRRIQPLVQALQADGYSVWWDEHIGTGDEWRQTIEQQLVTAKCVVVIWSKRSIGPEGHFVRDEAARAQRRHVYVPVLIDAVDPPLGFGESQATSLRGWHGDRSDRRYQSVLSAVRRIAGSGSEVGNASSERVALDRRTVLVAGGAAAVAAAGVGGWLFVRRGPAAVSGSIAVLPFANLSGNPEQAYFADGIAEEIRSALTRVADLKVVGRTSSEAVRNENTEDAAKKLDVANILTGSVRQSPSTIRVNAQLIDGRSGLNRWSNQYDRPPGDVIKIQTEIAASVAQALRVALGGAGNEGLVVGGTQNADAQRLFLRAVEIRRKAKTKSEIEEALAHVNRAIAIDENYADAHALTALLLASYADYHAVGVPELAKYRAASARSAEKASRLEPDLAKAHLAKAVVYQSDLNIAPAYAEMRRAFELAPGDAETAQYYSLFVDRLGRTGEALQVADKAVELDPLNPNPHHTRFYALVGARKYAEAVAYARALQRSSPELFTWPGDVAYALLSLGELEDVRDYLENIPADGYKRLVAECVFLAKKGDLSRAEERIERLRQVYGVTSSYQLGQMYAQLGDLDRAIDALQTAWKIRDIGLFWVKVDPFLDPLRRDPRLDVIVQRMNFPN